MNSLSFNATQLPKGGWLCIADTIPEGANVKVFDPLVDCFNPLKNLDYKRQCDITDIFDAAFPRGDNTLTKDNGLELIAEALHAKPLDFYSLIERPDKNAPPGHQWAYNKVKRILRSPVLNRVFDPSNPHFSPLSNPRAKIAARINRSELGDFDALILGLFLIAQHHGQVIIHDLAFYGREHLVRYVRENRLIGSVTSLDDLPPKLRRELMPHALPGGAQFKDAEALALRDGHWPGTDGFTSAVKRHME